MAFGEIAKQIAQHALDEQPAPQTANAAQSSGAGAVMVGQIQAMQRACKEDEELAVLVRSGPETIRVLEFIVPSWGVLVLAGVDEEKRTTRIVTTPESVQLVCKVLKAQGSGKPVRVGFRIPKAKPE